MQVPWIDMASSGPHSHYQEDIGVQVAMLVATILLSSWILWEFFHAELVYWSLRLNWILLGGLTWGPTAQWASATRHNMEIMAASALRTEPGPYWELLNTSSRIYIPFVLIAAALLARKIWNHPSNHAHRVITADRLRWIMSVHAPAIIPVLYYGDLLTTDPEEHRPLASPKEWALQHRLVINHRLDRHRARDLLIAQLGRRITSPYDLKPHERAMFAVFGARLFADGKEHGQTQALLDELNRSCHRGTFNGKRGYPVLSITDNLFEKYARHRDVDEWVATHPFSRTLLHAMHLAAIKLGKAPSSHFRWLKGMDRCLWAALNSTGRKTPWIEGCAVFAQTQWENYVHGLGYSLTEPHLDDVLNAIEVALEKAGIQLSPE